MTSNTPDATSEGIVLVVEDDPSLRAALSAALSVRNIDHLEFQSVDEIGAMLSRGTITKPTCMLLDIRLGSGPTGLTVFQRIKDLGLGNRIPVIFMTGHGELDTAVEVMREGAFDFVTKPFSTPELMTKVEAALSASGVANQSAIVDGVRHTYASPLELRRCPLQVVVTYRELAWNTWIVVKPRRG